VTTHEHHNRPHRIRLNHHQWQRTFDHATALTFLFGAINYYLAHKSQFVTQDSVIQVKKDAIHDTFLQFMTIEHKE